MQKKQKSHKPYTGKIKHRRISRKSLKTYDSKNAESRETENRSESEDMSEPPMTTISELKEILPILAENKPIIEVHSGSKIRRMSNIDILYGACVVAGRFITDELQGIKIPEVIPSGLNLTIKSLEKIVLKEKANVWSIYSHFRSDDGKPKYITTDNPLDPGMDSKESAITYAEYVIGQLIFEDSKINPDNRLSERTILIDKMPLVMVSSDVIKKCKDEIDKDPEFCREKVNIVLQQTAYKLGGSISQESLQGIEESQGSLFFQAAHLAVALGIKRWPFE